MAVINWFYELGDLKRIARSGWWSAKVRDPETVAEHSFRAAVVAYALASEEGEDAEHVAFLTLLHDAHEARTLDLHKVSRHYVKADEEKAGKDQLAGLPNNLKRKLSEKPSAEEAKIIRDADLLELALTAQEYAAAYPETKIWRERAGEALQTKTAKKWFAQLKKTRPSGWYEKFRKK